MNKSKYDRKNKPTSILSSSGKPKCHAFSTALEPPPEKSFQRTLEDDEQMLAHRLWTRQMADSTGLGGCAVQQVRMCKDTFLA